MDTQARELERKRAAQAELAAKYRTIGPAAILAALVCKKADNDKRQPLQAPLKTAPNAA
jgi:hypothetical protein